MNLMHLIHAILRWEPGPHGRPAPEVPSREPEIRLLESRQREIERDFAQIEADALLPPRRRQRA